MDSHANDCKIDDMPLTKRLKVKRLKQHSSIDEKDKFCWICHKENGIDELKCSNCILTFHSNCLRDIHHDELDWKCPECRLAEKPEDWTLGECSLGDILKLVFKNITKENCVTSVPVGYKNNKLLVNPITYGDIAGKTKRADYPSTHEFLMDIKWLHHNCEILQKYGGMHKNIGLLETLANTKSMLIKIDAEFNSIKFDSECYVYDLNGIHTHRVCSKPHLVVWAKFLTYPYWPAKVLTNINHATKTFEVLFFQEHNMADVSCDDCYLFTNKDPNNYLTGEYKKEVRLAMEEANKYLKNVEKKFGPVQLPSAFNIKPVFENLETEHVNEMFPGFHNIQVVLHQNVSKESLQTDNELEAPKMDNANVADEAKCQHRSEAGSNARPCIPINKSLINQLQLCLQSMCELKSENESQRMQIAKLQAENERLKEELAQVKQIKYSDK